MDRIQSKIYRLIKALIFLFPIFSFAQDLSVNGSSYEVPMNNEDYALYSSIIKKANEVDSLIRIGNFDNLKNDYNGIWKESNLDSILYIYSVSKILRSKVSKVVSDNGMMGLELLALKFTYRFDNANCGEGDMVVFLYPDLYFEFGFFLERDRSNIESLIENEGY